MSATDEETVGGEVRYALTNAIPFSALTQFSIDRATGHISLVMPLDRETNPSITLVVTASDMGEPGQKMQQRFISSHFLCGGCAIFNIGVCVCVLSW